MGKLSEKMVIRRQSEYIMIARAVGEVAGGADPRQVAAKYGSTLKPRINARTTDPAEMFGKEVSRFLARRNDESKGLNLPLLSDAQEKARKAFADIAMPTAGTSAATKAEIAQNDIVIADLAAMIASLG
jgi:hypothetical protein